jgi:hypothetical protein
LELFDFLAKKAGSAKSVFRPFFILMQTDVYILLQNMWPRYQADMVVPHYLASAPNLE